MKSFNRKNIITFSLFIINIVIGHFIINEYFKKCKLEKERKSTLLIANISNSINQQLSKTLSAAHALGALIQQHGDIASFDVLAKHMIDNYGGISTLEIAKDGIINKVFPYEPNKSIIGLDLFKSKHKDEVLKAIKKEDLLLSGPYELSQGGIGIIGRYPVFIKNSANEKQFWGFTIVLINFEDFLEYTGIKSLEGIDYDYWLWRISPKTKSQHIFASSKNNKIIPKETVNFSFNIPSYTWTLSAIPKTGWVSKKTIIFWYTLLGISSLIISFLSYFLLSKNELLKLRNTELETTKDKLEQTNLALQNSEHSLKIQNTTKDKLFSIIAHDLRGPIFNFEKGLNVLLTNHDLNDKEGSVEMLEALHESAKSTNNMLENLLFWAKSQRNELSIKKETINLLDVFNSCILLLTDAKKDKNLTIVNTITKEDYIYTDKNIIEIIIRNLLSNAIKFSHKNKSIYISIIENSIEYITISIKDEGVGIDPDRLKKIFNSKDNLSSTYGTFGENGTGLGLILCKEFIEKLEGKIWVKSELNESSEFFFSLPKK